MTGGHFDVLALDADASGSKIEVATRNAIASPYRTLVKVANNTSAR